MKPLELRDYQIKDDAAIEQAWSKYRSVLYQLPTGGGKSVIIKHSINRYRNEQILVLAHKRRLLKQLKGHLEAIGITPGILGGGFNENTDAKILIASIRTVVKDARLQNLLKRNWDRVYIDEARHSRTGSYDTVLDALKEAHPNHKLLGVDATPYRKDKKRLDKHFQYMVVSSEDTASLIKKGYLKTVRTIVSPIGDIVEKVKEVANDYQQTQLSDYMRQPLYLKYVVDLYDEYGEGRQSIGFAVDKAHMADLKAEFLSRNKWEVASIDSDMSTEEIDTIYEQYENKEIDILLNIEMATEGVDLPDTKCIIGARPTKSLTLYLQMAGRGTRPTEDGSDLLILDACGWKDEFGTVVSPKHWSLNPEIDPNNPRKKNKVVGKTKDGKFVEDLSEFIGEIIEMTPEEYVEQLSGGIDRAKDVNKSIEEKMGDLLITIREVIEKAGAISSSEYKSKIEMEERSLKILWTTTELYNKRLEENRKDAERYKKEIEPVEFRYIQHVQVDLSKGQYFAYLLNAPYTSYYSRDNDPSFDEIVAHAQLSQLLADINRTFVRKDKEKGIYVWTNITTKINNLKEELYDLKSNLIDIKALEQKAKEHDQERYEQAIREFSKGDEEFILPEGKTMDEYFKGEEWGRKIIKIKVLGNQINNHHNKILVTYRTSRYNYTTKAHIESFDTVEKNYIKGERVIEIISDGKWQVPVIA